MKRRFSNPRHAARLALIGTQIGISFVQCWDLKADEKKTVGKKSTWNEVFSKAAIQDYVVKKGDSLSTIAKALFQDATHWKSIWALNQNLISSPDTLTPGIKLHFEAQVPAFSEKIRAIASESYLESSPFSHGRSTDWKRLPPQPWEHIRIKLPKDVDSSGFQVKRKIFNSKLGGFEPQAIPSTSLISSKGVIFGSRTEGDYLSMNDIVYIQAEAPLKKGEMYAITQTPTRFTSKDPERSAYSYVILGKVKILGVKHHVFVGKITSARYFIPRGSQLIEAPPLFTHFEPISGTQPTKGTLFLDHHFSTYTTAQHKEVFIDRGSLDGIQIGMVFRSYKHEDANTKKLVSKNNFIVDADIIVTAVSENFSSGLIIKSTSPIQEGASLSLVTDLSVLKDKEFEEKDELGSLPEDPEKLDTGEDEKLGVDDAHVLKQLENWKENSTTSDKTESADSALTPPSDLPPLSNQEAVPDQLPPPSEEAELPIEDGKTEKTEASPPPLDLNSTSLSSEAPPLSNPPSQETALAPPPELSQSEDMALPEDLPPPEADETLSTTPSPPNLTANSEGALTQDKPLELQAPLETLTPEKAGLLSPSIDPPFPELEPLPPSPQANLTPPSLPPSGQNLSLPPKSSESSSLLPPPEDTSDVLPPGLPILPPPT